MHLQESHWLNHDRVLFQNTNTTIIRVRTYQQYVWGARPPKNNQPVNSAYPSSHCIVLVAPIPFPTPHDVGSNQCHGRYQQQQQQSTVLSHNNCASCQVPPWNNPPKKQQSNWRNRHMYHLHVLSGILWYATACGHHPRPFTWMPLLCWSPQRPIHFFENYFVSVLGRVIAKLIHIIDAVRRYVTVVLPRDFLHCM